VACMVGFLSLLAGCGDCDFLIVERVRSPDGDHDAVAYSAACGFNVSINTQVTMLDAGEEVDGDRSPFAVIYGDDDGEQSRIGGPAVDVRWLAADTLLVAYRTSAKLIRAEPRHSGVSLIYRVGPDRPRTSTAPAPE
jgi:hypothetical protein